MGMASKAFLLRLGG
jgi:hypothetical protein